MIAIKSVNASSLVRMTRVYSVCVYEASDALLTLPAVVHQSGCSQRSCGLSSMRMLARTNIHATAATATATTIGAIRASVSALTTALLPSAASCCSSRV
jgi:hypothetical protein